MAMCTVADVRALINPKSVSDSDITSIIAIAGGDIAEETGVSSSSTDSTLCRACLHASAAIVLQKAKSNGELANQIQLGDSMRAHNVNADIAWHQQRSEYFVRKYLSSDYAIVYGRVGIDTVDSEG